MIGTVIIIGGVIGIIVLGNQRSADSVDAEANLNLVGHRNAMVGCPELSLRVQNMLKTLWGRTIWIVYLTILEVVTSLIFWLSGIMDDVLREREEVESLKDDINPEDEYGKHSSRDARPVNDNIWSKIQAQQQKARTFLKSGFASWAARKPDPVVKKMAGFLWASAAGLLSCVVLCISE